MVPEMLPHKVTVMGLLGTSCLNLLIGICSILFPASPATLATLPVLCLLAGTSFWGVAPRPGPESKPDVACRQAWEEPVTQMLLSS